MRVTCIQSPDGLVAGDPTWHELARQIVAERTEILVTNEMPFGPWLAASPQFDSAAATRSIELHAEGIRALAHLGIKIVISSRPVWEGERLANEAVAIVDGEVRPIHRKQYFPAEDGWHETTWFGTAQQDFRSVDLGPLKVGALLCTEAMFNEHARAYGVQGAGLIAVPRATGVETQSWLIAGAMAAVVGGAYVVSSNRVGSAAKGPEFGGCGFAFAPGGHLLGMTDSEHPCLTVEIEPTLAFSQQRDGYPGYVARAVALKDHDP